MDDLEEETLEGAADLGTMLREMSIDNITRTLPEMEEEDDEEDDLEEDDLEEDEDEEGQSTDEVEDSTERRRSRRGGRVTRRGTGSPFRQCRRRRVLRRAVRARPDRSRQPAQPTHPARPAMPTATSAAILTAAADAAMAAWPA